MESNLALRLSDADLDEVKRLMDLAREDERKKLITHEAAILERGRREGFAAGRVRFPQWYEGHVILEFTHNDVESYLASVKSEKEKV